MSEWEKEKIRQSTLYIESERDDNDLDGYYEYNVEDDKKKHETHLDLDEIMGLMFIITFVVGMALIGVGVLHRIDILTIIGLILICANMIIGGLYCE